MVSLTNNALVPPLSRMGIKLLNQQQWSAFRKQLEQASSQQSNWLLNRIRSCEKTHFGRDHDFAGIRDLETFRKQVPVSEYDYFKPYIDEVAAGNPEALIPAHEKLMRFTITTGSSGTPKLNPVTTTWLKEYKKAWGIWGLKLFADHPSYLGKKMLQMAGTWEMGKTPGGYSISMISALLARNQSPLLRPFYAIPSDLNDIKDPIIRYYAALRLCMLDNMGWILLMNPGTLIRLAEVGDEFKEDLIKDFHDGTLTNRFEISTELREKLAPRIRKVNRAGASRLAKIVEQTGTLLPKDYWPNPVISCWLGGTAGFQSRYINDYFGNSPQRDMGLVSSEGRHTIPIEDGKPEGVPSIVSGFYEYMPVSEAGSVQPEVVEGHELEVGADYYLLMTTSAGYYRFNIGDIVRCTGFVGEAPLLEFIQKGSQVGDLEGEKLTEHQIVEAAQATAQELKLELGLFTAVALRLERQHPRYDFMIEIDSVPNADQAQAFLRLLDDKLAGLNFLWKARRKEGVLANPQLLRLPAGTWEKYITTESARRGTGDYQYKHPALMLKQNWVEQFSPVDIINL